MIYLDKGVKKFHPIKELFTTKSFELLYIILEITVSVTSVHTDMCFKFKEKPSR